MTTSYTSLTTAALLALSALSSHAWTPGVGSESDTIGFSVDTQSRNDVISFWNCVYMESEGFEEFAPTSSEFKDDVQRRVNYYRAMAGMSASIDFTSTSTVVSNSSTPSSAQVDGATTKQAAAEAAAVMLSANTSEFFGNGGVANGSDDPHNPPSSWVSDPNIARNGAFHSNLAVGLYGPDAIDAYISEDEAGAAGAETTELGHRRLILQLRLQELATGDVAGSGSNFDANALYVSGNLLPSASAEFIAWPNSGYIPEEITPDRWSLSYPSADFSAATVTMTDINGASVPLTIESTGGNFGDNTIGWRPTSIPSATTDDQFFDITIDNILIDGVATTHNYQVTVINPDRLLESSDLSGSTSPPDSGANYFFQDVPFAEQYRFRVSTIAPSTWLENANDATSIINETPLLDSQLRSTVTALSPSRSLRLAFISNTETFSAVEFDNTFIPRAGSQVQISTRRGAMLSTTTWALQIRSGDGVWNDLKTLTNSANSSSFPLDFSFVTSLVDIPAEFHDSSATLRIVYRKSATDTSFQLNQNPLVGVFTDDVSLINADDFEDLGIHEYAPSDITSVPLDSSTAGAALISGQTYLLSFSATVGCVNFPFGSALEVTPVAAASLSDYELWLRSQFPSIGGFTDDFDQDGIPNALERIFGLDPTNSSDTSAVLNPQISGSNLQLSHPILDGATVNAEYSSTLEADDWLPLAVTISAGSATASIPLEISPEIFIRWTADQ